MKDGCFAIHNESVTGVIAALKPNDDISVLSEEIDNFAFAFVSPLGADDCNVGHFICYRLRI
jgi:hypothetical protein